MSNEEQFDNPIDEPEEQKAAFGGFADGFKRFNLTKIPSDYEDEAPSYLLGYVIGFALKTIIVLGIAYGVIPPEVLSGA